MVAEIGDCNEEVSETSGLGRIWTVRVGRCELTAIRAKVTAVVRIVHSFIFEDGEDDVWLISGVCEEQQGRRGCRYMALKYQDGQTVRMVDFLF